MMLAPWVLLPVILALRGSVSRSEERRRVRVCGALGAGRSP